MEKYIQTPLTAEIADTLQAGDMVYITGTIYTARDAAHKRMQEMLDAGALMAEQMQVGLEESFVYMNREKNGGGADE